ncbi:hypothetical protein EDC19_1821 [Natranaerovirga hydrolytica]|uniref:CN hydrolase domain-containing protein n=1 Tax=Natranaerovirga hydrolytica TaxID=680378 RepID=A0A4R1MIV8_9FIRM|nr:hypothetical protein [Natranaerovirga hydrolytica]TCK92668.1 hypothetical protein EDC19_1821 [Natranaerovirga hydrolytica]
MKILVGQPKRTEDLFELENALKKYKCNYVLFPEGYISNESLLVEACELSKKYRVPILSSYLSDKDQRDRACVIDEFGKIVLRRKKSLVEGPLLSPSKALVNNTHIGYLLCCEIFLEYENLNGVHMLFNPIGVGMFSEEQFAEWSERAKKIAIDLKCIVLGTSHGDGSYRNCGTSIPIAYVYNKDGTEIFLSKNDTRTVIVDLSNKEVSYI